MSYKPFITAAEEALERQVLKQTYKQLYIGKSWGLLDLDRMTGGIQLPFKTKIGDRIISESGKLYFVLGEHKIGKTAFLTTVIRALGQQRTPFFYISGEQDELSIAMLTMIAEAKIDREAVRDLQVTDAQMNFMRTILKTQAQYDGVLGYSINRLSEIQQTINEINATRDDPICLIIFDYFQLMQIEKNDQISNRTRQLEDLSRRLTQFKEHNISVIIASQANTTGSSFMSSQPLKDADGVLIIERYEDPVTKKEDEAIRIIRAMDSRDWSAAECQVYFRSAYNSLEDIYVRAIDTMEFPF
jgi:replicative DNA helicase